MATGTGKTKTAVTSALRLYVACRARNESLAIVVVCPYLNLVDQWAEAFQEEGWQSIKAVESSRKWLPALQAAQSKQALIRGSRTLIITTQATFSADPFQSCLKAFSAEILLIADEVHNLGSSLGLASLPRHAKYRLGLSATPERHLDPEGTKGLLDFFGEIIFELNLKSAIIDGWLSPYRYFPRIVKMTYEETLAYTDYSTRLGQILSRRNFFELSPEEADAAGKLLRLRAALLGSIEGKWQPFWEDIQNNRKANSQLVYCAEGKTPIGSGSRQIDEVQEGLISRKYGESRIYDSYVDKRSRQEILARFKTQETKYILSMRCLDEGVDIPVANMGYLLASSANPRQFVQRRGRLLRKHPNKEFASIYDYFALPDMSVLGSTLEIEKVIVRRELDRALEFANACDNRLEAVSGLQGMGVYFE